VAHAYKTLHRGCANPFFLEEFSGFYRFWHAFSKSILPFCQIATTLGSILLRSKLCPNDGLQPVKKYSAILPSHPEKPK
jgi:hypothetical protein